MSFLENTRSPAGLGGKLMVRMMNVGHRALARWGLRCLPDIERDFLRTLNACRPVTEESIRQEKLSVKLTGYLAKVIAPLL